MTGERYLGDGLYASIERSMIKLRAPREEGDHVVYLEGAVWHALLMFVKEKVGERFIVP